jgi:CRP/FNR family cyclic AMP-dependent transcriptional regulator
MKLDPSAFLANPELIEALKARSVEVSCGDGYCLFRQGDPPTGLFILNQGEVTLSMTAPSGELLLSMPVGPGSLLGLPGLIGNEPYTLTAMARNGARLSFIQPDAFNAVMLSDPGLALKVLEVLAAEVRSARHAAQDLRPIAPPAHSAHESSARKSGANAD